MNHDSRSFEDELASLKTDVAVMRSNYVTKADLQEVRLELRAAIDVTKADLQEVRLELKGEIQAVRTELMREILALRTELHKALHAQTLRMYAFGAVLVTAVHFVTRAGY
jgi:predicted  nucleic acid-binding Zn-ribbon protein